MTDYSNWKLAKANLDKNIDQYSAVAEWCNESGQYHIEEQGNYYAVVKNPEPTQEEINAQRIAELKELLKSTDYVVIKIAEGAATAEDYADVIAQRQACRAEINRLEA